MGNIEIGILGFAALFGLIVSGVPIAFAMSAVGLVGLWAVSGLTAALSQATLVFWQQSTHFVLICIPLFILMGNIVRHTGIASDVFTTAAKWFGWLPGGLAIASVLGCAGFGAITGSSTASVATMGRIIMPEMRRFKYDLELGAGALTASGTLGILIPPSLIFIVYGLMTENSIGQLFIAGIIPGILTAVVFSCVIYMRCLIHPELGPRIPLPSWKVRFRSLLTTGPALAIFVVVIGGLYIGAFTPTEASAIGVIGVLLYGWASGRLHLAALLEALVDTVLISAMIFLIIVSGYLIARFVMQTGIAEAFQSIAIGLDLNKYVFIVLLTVVFLFLGCMLDVFGMMVLTIPFFYPVVVRLGFDPIWFGVYIVIMAEIALITPPIGVNVFIMRAIIPDVSMARIFRGIIPFFIAELLIVALLVVFPGIALMLVQ